MSDLKFSILENLYFAEHREMNKIELQNKLIENFPAPDVYQAFKDLHEDELIRAGLHDTTASLTKQGRIVYESVKEERAQQRKCEERERESQRNVRESNRLAKRANWITILSIIVTLLSLLFAIGQQFFFK